MKVIKGNCIEVLKTLEENSVDSVVTDPPYEIGFMGKSWDSSGIANNPEMWKECLRVLKPGGYLLSFSATRTYHRMAVGIEDAGFEIRDMIEWVYGSGFPKSLNIGKAVDKLQGNKREITGNIKAPRYAKKEVEMGKQNRNVYDFVSTKGTSEYEGWGTALKPSHEPICMARKPLAEKTVAENCLKWGTGGINIDESRVGTTEQDAKAMERCNTPNSGRFGITKSKNGIYGEFNDAGKLDTTQGRFPANLLHDNSEEVRACFPETKGEIHNKKSTGNSIFMGDGVQGSKRGFSVKDSGNASRFFKSIIYQAKPSKKERNAGCEGNGHPTVKPIALMEYLIKMVTPKGGVVLDPFMGSGTTGCASIKNGFDFIGIDLEEEYIKIATARIKHYNIF